MVIDASAVGPLKLKSWRAFLAHWPIKTSITISSRAVKLPRGRITNRCFAARAGALAARYAWLFYNLTFSASHFFRFPLTA